MKCPHCLENFHAEEKVQGIVYDADGCWDIEYTICPACKKCIISLINSILVPLDDGRIKGKKIVKEMLVYPKGSHRPPCPKEVDDTDIADDYKEACLVLPDSPKASAALSRRCLQNILVSKAEVKEQKDLSKQIQDVLDSRQLPSHIAEHIDAIRNIGNFSAHPTKSTSSGEIIPVEPEEAEWNLEVLEFLFDFYYVQPAKSKAKRDALNAKLKEAGKPEMK